MNEPSLRPTRIPVLLGVAAVAAVVTSVGYGASYGSLPTLPPLAPTSLGLAAVAAAYLAGTTRARLAGRPGTRPILPVVVARTAVAGRACALVGALGTGLWVGVAVVVAPKLASLGAARHDALVAGVGLACALGLVAAALSLERACRVR